uniref:BZIP domain-containing protein n=1 Tax=Steinernema glaseri TaxID=37863 RepID=A0A1I7YDD7_9BILA
MRLEMIEAEKLSEASTGKKAESPEPPLHVSKNNLDTPTKERVKATSYNACQQKTPTREGYRRRMVAKERALACLEAKVESHRRKIEALSRRIGELKQQSPSRLRGYTNPSDSPLNIAFLNVSDSSSEASVHGDEEVRPVTVGGGAGDAEEEEK